ncbi:hypothetical protein [Kitasatospora camelliae]|uniref:Uncharacterized protein n=1 Tax=Kitasatospora camelliae TaxID=3156397 RepID=A0AAU8K4I5_9ACTN
MLTHTQRLPERDPIAAAVRAAELELGEYCAHVQARRRAQHPHDAAARCRWTAEELEERDRLARVVDELRTFTAAA